MSAVTAAVPESGIKGGCNDNSARTFLQFAGTATVSTGAAALVFTPTPMRAQAPMPIRPRPSFRATA
jgi:hypothetical protein